MKPYQYVVVGLFIVFLCVSILYPNIFGNQPDAIADESYFLTSALQSIQKHTLPGWEFSSSGAYYGGIQAYVDTAVLVPVLAVEFFIQGRSMDGLQLWVALHTGTLLHVLRLVNGAAVLCTFFLVAYCLMRWQVASELLQRFSLLGALLLGNSLVVMLAHTAKVWVWYLIFEAIIAILVLTQEYYLREQKKSFLSTSVYVGLLLWLSVAAFFQTFVGAFTAGLWLLWAWWLGHFSLFDVWRYVRKWWYLFILFALTQISFVWRAFFQRDLGNILDLQNNSSKEVGIDWGHRFLAPLQEVFLSQPFLALYVLLAIFLLVPTYRHAFQYPRRYIVIALVHPFLVYLFFYPLLGFDLSSRYAVLLAVACSFSIAMLIPRGKAYVMFSAGTAVLAGVVLFHAVQLYWTPSYQTRLLTQIEESYNATSNAIVVDPSAIGFQLPMNGNSLLRLDSTGKSMSRYAYLLLHMPQVSQVVPFRSLVLYPRTSEEKDHILAEVKKEDYMVYVVSLPQGEQNTAEPNTLAAFLNANRIGSPYVVEKISP